MEGSQQRWRVALEAWKIPDEIHERAPESPWGFPPSLFRAHLREREPDTPSHRRAREALPEHGTVLDVGAGAGASSLPLAPKAKLITAVDESQAMLSSFAAAADQAGISHREIRGTWPDDAAEAGAHDVVVCHHVFYNVSELGRFAEALTSAARRRVVVELTAVHPASTLNHLWRHFHGLERPSGPTYEDAVAVLHEIGLHPEAEQWSRPPRRSTAPRSEVIAFVRRRLCLSADHDPELDRLIDERMDWRPREVVTLWWQP